MLFLIKFIKQPSLLLNGQVIWQASDSFKPDMGEINRDGHLDLSRHFRKNQDGHPNLSQSVGISRDGHLDFS